MNRGRRRLLAAALAGGCAGHVQARPAAAPRLEGMVWQPNQQTTRPRGRWETLGIRHLLVQWTAVDNLSLLPDAGLPLIGPQAPDWGRIAAEPWAHDVIVGLAGMHAEAAARIGLAVLAEQSRYLQAALARWPLRVSGWYFPVEADPTWAPPPAWRAALDALPRPLWISAYDSANQGPDALASWLARWVPADVGVFFQDGVGVHARQASVAREYLGVLSARLGAARVRVIAEAFRPAPGGFRSATAEEFLPQLQAYEGWMRYAFDGPHYLNDRLIDDLRGLGVGS